jgi:hypothetical protein
MSHDAAMKTTAVLAAAALIAGTIAIAGPAHSATITLTSAELTQAGFPKKPNTAAWGGTATITGHKAPQMQDVIVTGKASAQTPVGQVLTMSRFIPTDKQGSGSFTDLNISTTVQKDGNFTLHFQLGLVGTYGYRVGYSTQGPSPEFISFQFQFTTTGAPNGEPTTGSDAAVRLTAKQLNSAGFTKRPNTVGWGATPVLITSSQVRRGAPVTIAGASPSQAKPGQTLQLMRFVATDRLGSGHFEPTGITTKVRKNGGFSLTFEPADRGLFGYTLGYPTQSEWIGIEFRLRVR